MDHRSGLTQKRGAPLFVQRQRPPTFGKLGFGGRYHSPILEKKLQSQAILLDVEHAQRGSDGAQMPRNDSHYLSKEVIQFGRRRQGIETTPESFVGLCQ